MSKVKNVDFSKFEKVQEKTMEAASKIGTPSGLDATKVAMQMLSPKIKLAIALAIFFILLGIGTTFYLFLKLTNFI